MARGVNKVILIGYLGKDPEVRYMPSGAAVANISIATSESWKDKQSGEQQERTEWHNIVFYNRLAEIVGEYLKKGSQIYVEGSLRTRKWQDKNTGADRYTTEIIANEMQMLGGKGDSSAKASSSTTAGKAAQPPRRNDYAEASQAAGHAAAYQGHTGQQNDFDDDIPF